MFKCVSSVIFSNTKLREHFDAKRAWCHKLGVVFVCYFCQNKYKELAYEKYFISRIRRVYRTSITTLVHMYYANINTYYTFKNVLLFRAIKNNNYDNRHCSGIVLQWRLVTQTNTLNGRRGYT